jgi:hypothetical protein
VATLEGRMPTYEQLRGLKYVKWCLNECKSPTDSYRTISLSMYARLTKETSSAHPPRRPRKLPHRHPRHHPPARRWPRQRLPPLRPRRHPRLLLPLRHAPPHRHLRPRRRGVPARALGDASPGLGVLAV